MDFKHGGRSASLPRSGGHALPAFQADLLDQSDEYFRVVIRVRPPLDRELASPVWQHVVSVPGSTQICLYETVPEMNAADRASGTSQVVNTHSFSFDHVYDQNASQPTVYESTARTSVMSALQGYNATILAYGPTGTGKTYTMEGGLKPNLMEDARGIIPRSMEDIFEHIRGAALNDHSTFQVRASYLQIYNEVISDLLKPDRSHLMIREDKRRGVFVEGLSEWLCRSADEVQTLMEHGSSARATAQTGANDTSSRSHAVFIIVVERSGAEDRGRHTGRLNLVDLAGSERPRLTGATGQRLEETKKINQSLSALGNVISALTERRARYHVPYRDSKLTRLLEDSLGGNCRTTMMAMVSPAAEAFAESLSTLKFAQRAKGVVVTPQVNEDLDPRIMASRYEAEIRRLRSELAEQTARTALESADGPKLEPDFMRTPSSFSGGRNGSFAKILMEEDKAPAGRYKQLLLKQRDIMITLTQRLHERDETILSLQAELDSREHREKELQERLERQAVRLAAAEKALQASSKANMANMSGGSWNVATPARSSGSEAELSQLPRYLPESGSVSCRVDVPSRAAAPGHRNLLSPDTGTPASAYGQRLLSADDKVLELTSLLETQRQENHRIKLELEAVQTLHEPPSLATSMAQSFSRQDPANWADAEVRSLRGRSQGAERSTPSRRFR